MYLMCIKMNVVVLLYLIVVTEISAQPGPGEGPKETKYMMYFNTELMVADDGQSKDFADTSNVTVEWLDDTTARMYGFIKFLKTFEENTMLQLTLTKEVSGKNEIVVARDICDLCKEIGNEDSEYYEYLKHFKLPDNCPFDAGDYLVDNYVMDSDDFPLNSNTMGQYMATMDLYKNPSGDCQGEKIFLCSLKMGLTIEMA